MALWGHLDSSAVGTRAGHAQIFLSGVPASQGGTKSDSIHPGSSVFEDTFFSSKAVTNEVAATEVKFLLIKERGTIYHLCFIDYLTLTI